MVQLPEAQQGQSRKKFLLLKLAIVVLYADFTALVARRVDGEYCGDVGWFNVLHRSCGPNNLLYGVNTAINRLSFHS
jgi:hypothetical protein